MPILFQRPVSFSQAIATLAEKELLPTGMGSADLRQWSRDMRAKSIFSARTTHAGYLETIKEISNKMLSGEMNIADGRAALQDKLDSLSYTPELGFPGQPVPPGQRGSITDLSSDRRLKLVLETVTKHAQNFGRREQGMAPDMRFQFPAWELVRIAYREEPRDLQKDTSEHWVSRFMMAGGTPIDGRLIALKDDAIWENLGDSGIFDDGLDSSVPPYAFNSGMGWREVGRDECRELGLIYGDESPAPIADRFFDETEDINRSLYTEAELQELISGLREAEQEAAA